MARRQRQVESPEQVEEEPVQNLSGSEQEGDEDGETPQEAHTDKLTVKVVRAMLALNNTSTPIHRINVKKLALGDEDTVHSRYLDAAILDAQKVLKDVYGFTLVELPPKETTSAQGKKTVSKTKQWIIVSALDDRYLKFIQESQWLRTSNYLFESELLEERGDYRNSKEERPTLNSDNQLLIQGLAITIISLIVINNNHMNEDELLQLMSEHFGVTKNRPIPIVKLLPEELLKLLDKQEYVIRTAIKNDAEEIVEYKLGRRGLLEFDRDSFVEFVKILYDEPEDRPEFIRAIDSSIESAYGKRVDPIPEVVGDEEE